MALKRPRVDIAHRADVAATLRREAALLTGLSHPHVVTLIEASPDLSPDAAPGSGIPGGNPSRSPPGTTPFLALEFLGGGSLQAIRGPVPDIAALLAGVAAALDWLHGQGIVHGDVKPANLLRDAAGRVKLIDFGAAAGPGLDFATPEAVRPAAPAFAAPERLLGQPPDGRDDVYSLAVVAYGLLTGHHPFGHDPILALDPPPRPAGLPTRGWACLRAALASARAARPASPGELIAALGNPPPPTEPRSAHAGSPLGNNPRGPDPRTGARFGARIDAPETGSGARTTTPRAAGTAPWPA